MAFEPYSRPQLVIERLRIMGGYWLWFFGTVAWAILVNIKCLCGFHKPHEIEGAFTGTHTGRYQCSDCWRILEHRT